MVRLSSRALLILAACVACAAKLHAGGSVQPTVATQEVIRCLSVVRAAARRGSPVSTLGRRDENPVTGPGPLPGRRGARLAATRS